MQIETFTLSFNIMQNLAHFRIGNIDLFTAYLDSDTNISTLFTDLKAKITEVELQQLVPNQVIKQIDKHDITYDGILGKGTMKVTMLLEQKEA